MDNEYYRHQETIPFPEGSRLPTMDALTERLVHYAEGYGRVHTSSTKESERRRKAEKEVDRLTDELERSRRDRRFIQGQYDVRGERIVELEKLIAKLEKKLPKKPVEKTAKKVKK